jgi:hypothetical protein
MIRVATLQGISSGAKNGSKLRVLPWRCQSVMIWHMVHANRDAFECCGQVRSAMGNGMVCYCYSVDTR